MYFDFRLEDADDLSDCHPLRRLDLPTPLDCPPQLVRELWMMGAVRAMSLPHGDNPSNLWLVREWYLARKYLRGNSPVQSVGKSLLRVATHFTSKDPGSKDVRGLRSPGSG